nr:ycf20-like protein [Ipomoea batatas]
MQFLKDIVPAALNNINTKFIVLDKGRVDAQQKTCLALVADETAAVHFQMWGDECDQFEPGDIITLSSGIFSYNRNALVLRAGKRGKAEKVTSSMVTNIRSYGCHVTSKLLAHKYSGASVEVVFLEKPSSLTRMMDFQLSYSACNWGQPTSINKYGRIAWLVRSSADGRGLNSSPTNDNGNRTRLIRAIESFQVKLNARIKGLMTNLPMKLLLLLIGFYSATAFATVIGQTGDWDVLSAALAVVVVEGIGALMYKTFSPFVDKVKDLITMLNYWKTGLTLGLFLDSFKY